jgi:nitrite reductase (NADH) small subunit
MIRVCSVEDVPPGEGRTVWIDGRRIAVFRAEDGWFALDGTCPHLGGPLADGIVASRTVICPLHERRFDLATGQEAGGGYCVAAHRVEVRGTDVYLERSRARRSPEPLNRSVGTWSREPRWR